MVESWWCDRELLALLVVLFMCEKARVQWELLALLVVVFEAVLFS